MTNWVCVCVSLWFHTHWWRARTHTHTNTLCSNVFDCYGQYWPKQGLSKHTHSQTRGPQGPLCFCFVQWEWEQAPGPHTMKVLMWPDRVNKSDRGHGGEEHSAASITTTWAQSAEERSTNPFHLVAQACVCVCVERGPETLSGVIQPNQIFVSVLFFFSLSFSNTSARCCSNWSVD